MILTCQACYRSPLRSSYRITVKLGGDQGWGEYYSGTRLAQNDKHEYTKNNVLEYWFYSTRIRMFSTRPSPGGDESWGRISDEFVHGRRGSLIKRLMS